jgi:hypothetical protein
MEPALSNASNDYWAFWAADARRIGCELYARLAEEIGRDETLKGLAARSRKGQPHANMLLGAVHFLLLRGVDHPLKRFYLSAGGETRVEDEDPRPLFRDFIERNRGALTHLIETRVTNTNEVGRSAILHAGFRALAGWGPPPLHLVEVGPSAGLNLIWDSYGVRYAREGRVVAGIETEAELVLDCELRGGRVPPTGPTPAVARRLGLEINPVALGNRDDRDWLRALVWPNDPARMKNLATALGMLDRRRPEIRVGDALALLPDALAEAPSNETLCVYHTIAVYQLNRREKQALDDILTVVGLRRPVFRLGLEYVGADSALELVRYFDGTRDERALAVSHPHGRWLEWRA